LAAERKIPAFSGENAWYGLDPIHPRRRAAGEIWQRMLSALEPSGRMPAWTSPPRGDAKLLRRIHAESWSPEVLRRDAPPPSAQLADGATVTLF
jgi:hypothetical protein